MKKKITFADAVIVLCLTVSLAITVVVLCEYHRLNEVMSSGVITALLGLWGGELLIVALRQVLGSDVTRRNSGQMTNADDNSDSPAI